MVCHETLLCNKPAQTLDAKNKHSVLVPDPVGCQFRLARDWSSGLTHGVGCSRVAACWAVAAVGQTLQFSLNLVCSLRGRWQESKKEGVGAARPLAA